MSDDDTPIWGAANIGKEANLDPRQAWYLLDRGELPAWKVGRRWVSTRRLLRERFSPRAA